MNFYSASSMKQQSTGRHVVPFRHIVPFPSQPISVPTPYCCLHSGGAAIPILEVFGSNLQSTTLEKSTLTITPPMQWIRFMLFYASSYENKKFSTVKNITNNICITKVTSKSIAVRTWNMNWSRVCGLNLKPNYGHFLSI